MKNADFPPKPTDENDAETTTVEHVESYSTPEEVDPHLAALRQRAEETKEADQALAAEKLSEIDQMINKTIDTAPKGDEVFEDPRKQEEKTVSAEEHHTKGRWKKWMMALGFAGAMATGAKAGTVEKGGDDDSTLTKTEHVIAPKQANFQGARNVKEISSDYSKFNKGDTTFGVKTTAGKTGSLEMAKAGSNAKEDKGYQDWLIQQLGSGISPEELAAKKYISSDKIESYRQYYKAPSVDVVYTVSGKEKQQMKQETKTDPFAAFAKRGDVLYGPDGHAVADEFYATRSSNDIHDGGALNTQESDVLLVFEDGNGKPTGETTIIQKEKLGDLLAGTHSFLSEKKIEEAKALGITESKNSEDLSSK